MSNASESPKLLVAGMSSWHLGHTAREFQAMDALTGYWVSNSNKSGVRPEFYKRIWWYYAAQKPFYHCPFPNLEEKMRWWNLPFYDAWMARRKLPEGTNVVQGPMGSCQALFALANRSGRKVLKVYDAPNSHPTTQFGYWQRELDLFAHGEKVPIPYWVRSRMNREIADADLVLCPSNFVRDTMVANGVHPDKCFVSHFGVDTSIFRKRAAPPAKPRFITVGSLTFRKGHHYLFRAFEIVKHQLPEAELVCVGGVRPGFEDEMRKWGHAFTHIEGLPHAELAAELATATAFVFPSLEEGFARVLSEAMAVGLPLIASYESGATTVMTDGREGIVIRPQDIQGMAEAMIAVARDPDLNRRMGDASYEVGGKSNTWADYAKRLHGVYCRSLS